MRQGPNYNQHVDRGDDGTVRLRLPLELEHEWEDMKSVMWRDNGDGTYTLSPSKSF